MLSALPRPTHGLAAMRSGLSAPRKRWTARHRLRPCRCGGLASGYRDGNGPLCRRLLQDLKEPTMDLPKTAKVSALHVLQAKTPLYRVHDEHFSRGQPPEPPCRWVRSIRFTPLYDENDRLCVPASYAATTLDGAAFETIFRGIASQVSGCSPAIA